LGNRVFFGQLTPRRRLSEFVTEQRLQLHLSMNRLASRASELRPGNGLESIAHASKGGMKNPRVRIEPRRHDLRDPDTFSLSAPPDQLLVDPLGGSFITLERQTSGNIDRWIHEPATIDTGRKSRLSGIGVRVPARTWSPEIRNRSWSAELARLTPPRAPLVPILGGGRWRSESRSPGYWRPRE
jgi:hypothetical protein